MGKLYEVVGVMIRTFSKKMQTIWDVPFDGEPCVFLCNHAGALGPIDMCTKFPLRKKCFSWMNADMLDAKAVPAYVRQDYWWQPGCLMEPLYNITLPYIAAILLPPLLKSAPGVPVYHDARGVKTFRQSIRHLKNGNCLIIFPEQPSGYQSHHTWINEGFLQIAPLAYRTLGIALKFYPVHLDHKNHLFHVSKPIRYEPGVPLDAQKPAMIEAIRQGIHPPEPLQDSKQQGTIAL